VGLAFDLLPPQSIEDWRAQNGFATWARSASYQLIVEWTSAGPDPGDTLLPVGHDQRTGSLLPAVDTLLGRGVRGQFERSRAGEMAEADGVYVVVVVSEAPSLQ
jgi:hypothetical protein